jgi:hypothetical protein
VDASGIVTWKPAVFLIVGAVPVAEIAQAIVIRVTVCVVNHAWFFAMHHLPYHPVCKILDVPDVSAFVPVSPDAACESLSPRVLRVPNVGAGYRRALSVSKPLRSALLPKELTLLGIIRKKLKQHVLCW